jgi:hypothetical protein
MHVIGVHVVAPECSFFWLALKLLGFLTFVSHFAFLLGCLFRYPDMMIKQTVDKVRFVVTFATHIAIATRHGHRCLSLYRHPPLPPLPIIVSLPAIAIATSSKATHTPNTRLFGKSAVHRFNNGLSAVLRVVAPVDYAALWHMAPSPLSHCALHSEWP